MLIIDVTGTPRIIAFSTIMKVVTVRDSHLWGLAVATRKWLVDAATGTSFR